MDKLAYEVFVEEIALELVVPAVVETLLLDQITNVDVAEIGSLGEGRRRRRFASPRRASYEYVWPLSFRPSAAILCHCWSSRVVGPTRVFD